MKHNKKRNTAFLYETLIAEMTKGIIKKDDARRSKAKRLIKKYFRKGTALNRELDLYNSILETRGVDKLVAEKIIFEAKTQRKFILDDAVFQEQTELIGDMNKEYTKSVFSNFIPNYKNLATLAQIFNTDVPIKNRVLLETKVIDYMTSAPEEAKDKMEPIDNLVFNTFVKKFNEKYTDSLNENQKALLTRYISSFGPQSIDFKIYLNDELGRLKESVRHFINETQATSDVETLDGTQKVLTELESYSSRQINEGLIRNILKIQQLVQELESDDS